VRLSLQQPDALAGPAPALAARVAQAAEVAACAAAGVCSGAAAKQRRGGMQLCLRPFLLLLLQLLGWWQAGAL
jgi:hypothetical protein